MIEHETDSFVGTSTHCQHVRKFVREASASNGPVLLLGEPGTGKELAARTIHRLSPRAEQPFLMIDCSLYYERELRREIFGYRGIGPAAKTRKGILEFATRGTCLLARVEELTMPLQESLLEFLRSGSFRRLGDGREISSDVRLIAASEKNLRGFVDGGLFHRELYELLSEFRLEIAPLRERAEDIDALAFSIAREVGTIGNPEDWFRREALDALRSFPWPRNVDDLEKEIRRIVSLGLDRVRAEDLSFEIAGYWLGQAGDPDVRRVVEEIESCIREFRILSSLDAEFGDLLFGIRHWGVHTGTRQIPGDDGSLFE